MTHQRLGLLALCVLAAGPFAGAQEPVADMSLFRALAESVRAYLPAGLIILDPRVLPSGHAYALPPAVNQNHGAGTLSALQRVIGPDTARIEDLISCGSNPSTCRLVRGMSAARFSTPQFHGDSATVRVYLAYAVPSTRQPVGYSELLLILVRRGEVWQVVQRRVLYVT